MNSRMKLTVIIVLLSLVALIHASERCAQPGAVRCDQDGRHLSVCLQGSSTWLRARDCAASGQICAGDRCAYNTSVARSARADECGSSGVYRCSPECDGVQICLGTKVWYTYLSCKANELCDDNSNSCMAADKAVCSQGLNCPGFSARLPDLTNPSRFYDCTDGKLIGVLKECPENDGEEDYYNACSGKCDYSNEPKSHFPEDCTNSEDGYSDFVFSNPSLYYICINKQPSWQKCDKGYYENNEAACLGESDYSKTCSDVLSNSNTDPNNEPNQDPGPEPDPLTCAKGDRWSIKDDECHFYHCYSAGNVIVMTCNKNTKYSNEYKGCVYDYGSCTN